MNKLIFDPLHFCKFDMNEFNPTWTTCRALQNVFLKCTFLKWEFSGLKIPLHVCDYGHTYYVLKVYPVLLVIVHSLTSSLSTPLGQDGDQRLKEIE